MRPYNLEFLHLQEKVALSLKLLKIKNDFRSLVSTVGHDLASPLGYLEFSSELLTSQVGVDSSPELKETTRVIGSSTAKLSQEAKQLVDSSKRKIKQWDTEKSDFEKLITSSLDLAQLKGIPVEADKFSVGYGSIYQYIIGTLLVVFKNLNLHPERIEVVLQNHHIEVTFSFMSLDSESVLEIEEELKKVRKFELMDDSFHSLETLVDSDSARQRVNVSLKSL